MPFEFYNPHTNRVGCYLGAPHGEIKVEPGQYVPTPAQEDAGIKPEHFAKHVAPSFLHKTPGNIRRQLRVAHQAKAKERADAQAAVEAEDALVQSGAGGVATASEEGDVAPAPIRVTSKVPVPPTGGPRRPELPAGSLNRAANALQKLANRSASSGVGKDANA